MKTKNLPKVSIGLPVFNSEKYLSKTIECLLNQSYSNIELIISDNASTDYTPSICAELLKKDKRIRYYRNKENLGVIENQNAVVRLAESKYFKWASSSDLIGHKFIENCVEVLESAPDVVLCSTRTAFMDENDNITERVQEDYNLTDNEPFERYLKLFNARRLNNMFNGVIRNNILKKVKPLKKYRGSDNVLMFELALFGKFIQLPSYFFYRRMTQETSTLFFDKSDFIKFYDPLLQKPMLLQKIKFLFGEFNVFLSANLDRKTKMKLYIHLLRRTYWSRKIISKEILEGIKYYVSELGNLRMKSR